MFVTYLINHLQMPIIIAVIVIIALIAGVTFFTKDSDDVIEEVSSISSTDKITGTFTRNSGYLTPKKTSHNIEVTLTILDDIVTDANVIYDHKEGFTTPGQERFEQEYKVEVVGKNIHNISLSRVGGASLTSNSFNEIIDQIIQENS